MRGHKMSKSHSKRHFKGHSGTHRFNVTGPVRRGGIRL